MKKITILTVLILITVISCKKYPDGPLISFRSPLSRLLGKWEVTNVTINGDEATASYMDSCGCKFSFHSEKHDPKYFILFDCTEGYSHAGSFHFESKEFIEMYTCGKCNIDSCIYDTVQIFGPLKDKVTSIWNVRKLTFKKLWIENNYNGNNYIIRMEKYEKDN